MCSGVRGASILPYIVKHGQIYLILGRERYVHDFTDSCKWSGFGGSVQLHETDVQTAVREFDEETIGLATKKDSLLESLEARQYTLKLIKFATAARRPCYITYVKQLSSDITWVHTFNMCNGLLERMQLLSATKAELFKTLSNAATASSANSAATAIIDALPLPGRCFRGRHVTHVIKVCFDAHSLRVRYRSIDKSLVHDECVALDTLPRTIVCIYLAWVATCRKICHITRYLHKRVPYLHNQRNRHRSIGQEFCDCVTNMSTLNSNVEKDAIMLWSLDALESCLAHSPHVFRKTFIPTLRAILQEFRDVIFSANM